MGFMPVALYGLEVPCNGEIVPAVPSFPATFRVTMAAIDPSAPALGDKDTIPRATLKIIREAPIEDDESDEEDNEYMRDLMAESDDSDDEELTETERLEKRARKENALKELMASLGAGAEDSDEDMEEAPKSKKGKKVAKKATDEDSESEEESDEDDEDDFEIEEFVLCTLDPAKNYQQTLDIVVGENERVFFKVDGTHSIFLTGNYLVPDDEGNAHREVYDSDEESEEEDDEDYDLSPSEDELDMGEESDDLDDLDDPRITELSDEEVPELVAKKGKNKRAAEESLDEIMEKSATKTETLSKKQQKKLKTNEGKAAAVEAKESPKDAKSVKFAKNLEQGPTGSEAKKTEEKPKAALGPKIIQGVTIDDKKLGSGPAAQRGNRVSMRYIGKLKDGKVFDSNKKGKPFAFTLDKGEVIKGWDIGIKGMQVGGERRITIPADKGYGKSGVPGIPPNSTLIFDVKMLEIK